MAMIKDLQTEIAALKRMIKDLQTEIATLKRKLKQSQSGWPTRGTWR
jgi:peptidoglycan hydrolase CwlO-like protein